MHSKLGVDMQVQAAAISLAGTPFIIVLVDTQLVESAGEADMAIGTLSEKFGGPPVVLMGQREDGSPVYYGDADLVRSLRDVPVEEMPWKAYSLSD